LRRCGEGEREAKRKRDSGEKKTLGSSFYISPVRIVWAMISVGLLVLSLLTEVGLISSRPPKMMVLLEADNL
jgi:hypothetical protein